ncbi:MAG: hypothetical protein ABJF10_29530 [Chthoniobacter sp.]|uniref:hypothetical protein n=1 Tax=Chthoniobacter sp. TaxID=2510640 RepID=UPI0032A6942E
MNPNLTGSLAADHVALQNDLVQAQELAADFQRQLAGKSNEYAQLKQILEKTEKDLAHFNEGIVELRAERHRLANEAMRAVAFQAKLAKVTSERDRLRIDLEVIRHALAQKGEDMEMKLRDRDRHIAELVVEMVGLRQALEEARKGISPAPAIQPAIPRTPSQPIVQPLDEMEEAVVEIVRAAAR